MGISGLLDENLIFVDVAHESKESLLDFMGKKLFVNKYVKEGYIEGVKERERAFPTGLSLQDTNCAIPHTEMEFVIKPCVCIAKLQKPIPFNKMDNPLEEILVQLVFMLAVDDGHKQVKVLQELAQLLQSTETVNKLIQSPNTSRLVEIVKEFENSRKEEEYG